MTGRHARRTAYEGFVEASGLMDLLPPDEPWMWLSAVRRIIVCGGRGYADRNRVREILKEYVPEDRRVELPTIVHGGARGADKLAADVAMHEGFWVEAHPANWKRHGKGAGPRRNEEMAKLGADLLIAFPGGAGTEDMIRRAEARGIPIRRVDG